MDDDGDGYGDPTQSQEVCTQPAGYVVDATDCLDTDITVNPDAPEICDGQDNDCDGLSDDSDPNIVDQQTWYLDADQDGYGTNSTTVISCIHPPYYISHNNY